MKLYNVLCLLLFVSSVSASEGYGLLKLDASYVKYRAELEEVTINGSKKPMIKQLKQAQEDILSGINGFSAAHVWKMTSGQDRHSPAQFDYADTVATLAASDIETIRKGFWAYVDPSQRSYLFPYKNSHLIIAGASFNRDKAIREFDEHNQRRAIHEREKDRAEWLKAAANRLLSKIFN